MKLTTQRLKKLIREELEKMNEQDAGKEYYEDFDQDLEFVIDNDKKTIIKIDNNTGYPGGEEIKDYSSDPEEFKKEADKIRQTYDKVKS